MVNEQRVQLNPGSGGSSVRTSESTQLQADGTLATVEAEYVVLADVSGNAVDLGALLERMAAALESIDRRLERLQFARGAL